MKKVSAWLCCLAVVLAGCAGNGNMPEARKPGTVPQDKIAAAQHWNMIARDVVAETQRTLRNTPSLNNRLLYVKPGDSDFEQGFSSYIKSGLVTQGVPVATTPEGALEVSYTVQVIRHQPGFNPEKYGYIPGTATAEVAGFWILRDAVLHASRDTWIGGTMTIAAAYDVYRLFQQDAISTSTELLVTTYIADNNRYYMHKTDAYYIERADAALFSSNVLRTWKVVQ